MRKLSILVLILSLLVITHPALASGYLDLSQTSVNLNIGQSITITATPPSGQIVNLTSLTNSYVAYANVSGNQITIYALTSGVSNMTFCTYDNYCGNFYVMVNGYNNGYNYNNNYNYNNGNYYNNNGYNYNGQISFSQSSVNLNVNQSTIVTVYNPASGSVYISSNSNLSVASAYLSSSNGLTLTGIAAGSATITVCGSGSCGNLYVSVNGTGNNSGLISFSQSNVNLSINQSTSVYVYNSTSSQLYISNNSNSSVVSASLSVNNLNLTGINNGSATITVCGAGSCGSIFVTVSGSNGYNGQISFSQSSVNLNVNQSTNVQVYNSGSNSLYISSNSNSSVVNAYISGSNLYLTGVNAGSATINVCSYSNSCGNSFVTVSGNYNYNNGYNNNNGQISLSQTSVSMVAGNFTNVTVYNSTNQTPYLSQNSNPQVVSATYSGTLLALHALTAGYSTITICANSYSNQSAYLSLTVTGYNNYVYNNGYGYNNYGTLNFILTSLPQPVMNQYYNTQLSVSGGTPPYTYSLYSGLLPTGLYLNSNGQIYGTPQNTQYSSFMIRATDTYGNSGISPTITLTPGYSNGSVLGSSTYTNGTLISDNGTVYITYKNTKSVFANSYAFTGLGYNFGNVINASTANLNFTGYTISNPNVAHPWGSWIRNNGIIYFESDQGLIPIPSMDIFVNNGGSQNMVVNANSYDLSRPILQPMTYNDYRLR